MNESRPSDGSRRDLTGVIAIGFGSFREVVEGHDVAGVAVRKFASILGLH
jgi:hypothetical protein